MVEHHADVVQNTSDLVSKVSVAIQGSDSMVTSNVVRFVSSLNSSLGALLTCVSPLRALQVLR